MIVKAEVTQEEKERIHKLAKAEGKSISAYVKDKALNRTDPAVVVEPLLKYIEGQAAIAQRLNSIVTTILKDKAVYETEILLLMGHMKNLEKTTADFLKEATGLMKGEVKKYGNSGHEEHQGNDF